MAGTAATDQEQSGHQHAAAARELRVEFRSGRKGVTFIASWLVAGGPSGPDGSENQNPERGRLQEAPAPGARRGRAIAEGNREFQWRGWHAA